MSAPTPSAPARRPSAPPAAPASAPPRTDAARLLNVVRLHLANPWTTVVLPLVILAGIFAVNWSIWAIIIGAIPPGDRADAQEGFAWNGALFYVFSYMLFVGSSAMTATFAYAMSLGLTRREFYLGSLLTFAGLSAAYAVLFTVLAEVERATGGWGVGGSMFAGQLLGIDVGVPARLWTFFLGLLFSFTLGAAVSAVFVRWRSTGLLAFFLALGLLLVGLAALVTLTQSWPAVGRWFVDAGPVGVVTALLVPTAAAAVAGYAVLRRATPRE